MNGNELKKITDALNSVGFDVKKIELERQTFEQENYTGAIIIRVFKKEESPK